MRLLISLLLINFALCSCGIYNTKFRCKEAQGIACKPLSEVNEMIDDGSIDFYISQGGCFCK